MSLDYSDNQALLLRAKTGDKDAEEKLLLLNRPLVYSIARRYLGRGTDIEDLQQIGMMGLLKAIRSFDLSRGCALSTYAVPLISGEIRRFLRDDGPVKVSRTQKKLNADLMAAREKMLQKGNDSPSIAELAAECGVTPEEAAAAIDSAAAPLSLSEPLANEDGGTLENLLSNEDEGEREWNRLALCMAMDKLPETARKILLLRYYRDFSQQKTAHVLGLTQVKVSREEKKILAFLHSQLA